MSTECHLTGSFCSRGTQLTLVVVSIQLSAYAIVVAHEEEEPWGRLTGRILLVLAMLLVTGLSAPVGRTFVQRQLELIAMIGVPKQVQVPLLAICSPSGCHPIRI